MRCVAGSEQWAFLSVPWSSLVCHTSLSPYPHLIETTIPFSGVGIPMPSAFILRWGLFHHLPPVYLSALPHTLKGGVQPLTNRGIYLRILMGFYIGAIATLHGQS